MDWVDLVAGIVVVAGALFCIIGGIGILRMPEFFSRTHAVGVSDTLGATLILLGLAFHEGSAWLLGEGDLNVTLKLLLLLLFLIVVSPTASHALARAAAATGVPLPALKDAADSEEGDRDPI